MRKNIGYLNWNDFDDEFLKILNEEHKKVLSAIVGCTGSDYYYRKILNERLWRFDIIILCDLWVFFALQEMESFCELINEAIEIKTLQFVKGMLKI